MTFRARAGGSRARGGGLDYPLCIRLHGNPICLGVIALGYLNDTILNVTVLFCHYTKCHYTHLSLFLSIKGVLSFISFTYGMSLSWSWSVIWLLSLLFVRVSSIPANLSFVLWNYNRVADCDKRTTIFDQDIGIQDQFLNQAIDCGFDSDCSVCTGATATITSTSIVTSTVTSTASQYGEISGTITLTPNPEDPQQTFTGFVRYYPSRVVFGTANTFPILTIGSTATFTFQQNYIPEPSIFTEYSITSTFTTLTATP